MSLNCRSTAHVTQLHVSAYELQVGAICSKHWQVAVRALKHSLAAVPEVLLLPGHTAGCLMQSAGFIINQAPGTSASQIELQALLACETSRGSSSLLPNSPRTTGNWWHCPVD